jgi:hypothetical protein
LPDWNDDVGFVAEGLAAGSNDPDHDKTSGHRSLREAFSSLVTSAAIVPQKSTTLPSAMVTRRSMRRCQFVIVGGDQRGKAGLAHQCFQRLEDIACGFRIEVAGRFVGEQQARRIGDGAGDCHALLLAAGQFAGAMRARWPMRM